MVYQLRPEAIKTFVNDTTIRLPRFQRKITWDEKKNFKLCLSLFKNYPLGVVVIKIHEGAPQPAQLQKFLLDGRQRRHAFINMQNPENIYDWARVTLKLKQKDTDEEICDKFWAEIERFFGEDEIKLQAQLVGQEATAEIEEAPSDDGEFPIEEEEEEEEDT